MSMELFDVAVTLNVVIAVNAESQQDANEHMSQLSTKELIELLNEQAPFLENNLNLTIKH